MWLRTSLRSPPVIDPATRFKYSNHGFGLVGAIIERVSAEAYGDWLTRNVIAAAKLEETTPDGPPEASVPFAKGHSGKLPLGRRIVIPANQATHAVAPATGLISTAADLARFFSALDPAARRSLRSACSGPRVAVNTASIARDAPVSQASWPPPSGLLPAWSTPPPP